MQLPPPTHTPLELTLTNASANVCGTGSLDSGLLKGHPCRDEEPGIPKQGPSEARLGERGNSRWKTGL